MSTELAAAIDAAWEARDTLSITTKGDVRDAVESAIAGLDSGAYRVAEKGDAGWTVNQWLKKAVLLSFRLNDNVIVGAEQGGPAFDKVPLKFKAWGENRFREAGFRAVPGADRPRRRPFSKGCVLMPSFVNIGAYVGEGTMVDTWTTSAPARRSARMCISPAASVSAACWSRCRPIRSSSSDGCFIGARSEVAEGVIVEEGAVLSMGVYLGASTKIVDRATGESVHRQACRPIRSSFRAALPGKDGGAPASIAR
jgi:2,3,4,5-tetrahydropyridine-2-carboxylate N-succinyltransferase